MRNPQCQPRQNTDHNGSPITSRKLRAQPPEGEFPQYASRAFLNTLQCHSPATIRCTVDADGDYSVRQHDCHNEINLHGNLSTNSPGRGVYNFFYKIDTIIEELKKMRAHVSSVMEFQSAPPAEKTDIPAGGNPRRTIPVIIHDGCRKEQIRGQYMPPPHPMPLNPPAMFTEPAYLQFLEEQAAEMLANLKLDFTEGAGGTLILTPRPAVDLQINTVEPPKMSWGNPFLHQRIFGDSLQVFEPAKNKAPNPLSTTEPEIDPEHSNGGYYC